MTWHVDHLNDRSRLRPLLFRLYLDGANPTVATYWTAWDHPVTAMGHTWTPQKIRLLSVQGNPDDAGVSATFEIANSDGSGVTFFAAAKQGSLATIWAGFLDWPGTSIAVAAYALVCGGLLGTWEAERDTLTVHVDPLLPWVGVPIPRRLYTTTDFPRLDAR